jgi:hypothetical protein
MRDAVDGQAASAADAFPAIVVKCDGLDILLNEALVDDVEHLKERSIRRNVICGIDLETAAVLRAILAPHS